MNVVANYEDATTLGHHRWSRRELDRRVRRGISRSARRLTALNIGEKRAAAGAIDGLAVVQSAHPD